MRAWIQCDKDLIPLTVNNYNALKGFNLLGYEIIKFHKYDKLLEYHEKSDVVSSGVPVIRDLLYERYGILTSEINYPKELEPYLKRKIWKSTINRVRDDKNSWPIFVKSVEGKRLTGKVICQISDLVGCGCSEEDYEVLCSEVKTIISEFRVFVRYGKILGIKIYKGEIEYYARHLNLNFKLILDCINDYKSAPFGYAIDFGIMDNGETILIEVNDGYSLGCYGLDSVYYAKLMATRWAQITNTTDDNWYF